MITTSEILQTLQMIDHQKLDVRTITMGISLLSCVTRRRERAVRTRVRPHHPPGGKPGEGGPRH